MKRSEKYKKQYWQIVLVIIYLKYNDERRIIQMKIKVKALARVHTSGCGATYGIVSHSSNSNAVSQTATQLKGLTGTLGSVFKNDSSNINGEYPILSWQ